jgi:hypothetical protein
MSRIAHSLYAICITLWVGGQWAIGYMVAPTLFAKLGDRALAGNMAGQLFALIAWVGIGCASYLILYLFSQRGAGVFKSSVFWLVVIMLLLTLAGHFGIQPILAQLKLEALPREVMDSILRDRFATWHGVSSVLYLLQSLLGLMLVLRQNR